MSRHGLQGRATEIVYIPELTMLYAEMFVNITKTLRMSF